MQYSETAPAKINLTLKITGKRDDGYHTLLSHVVFADFGDLLKVDISDSEKPQLTLSYDGVFADDVPADNTVTKAFDLFCEVFHVTPVANAKLTKNIPSKAGLGGGSSDAAAMLRILSTHFEVKDEVDELYTIAQQIGADVPVCLRNKPSLMRGTGEILEDFDVKELGLMPPIYCTLIYPGAGADTTDLYDAYDNSSGENNKEFDNDFMNVAPQFCPKILDAHDYLKNHSHFYKTGLTGSGSTVFGLSTKPFDPENHGFQWSKTCLINI